MWQIFEHRRVTKQIDLTPVVILKRYEKWKDVVTMSGPTGLRLIKGFHDEALLGKWKGCRSSRLSEKYRIIYKVVEKDILVQVISITPHDYRKKLDEKFQKSKENC